MHLMARIRTTEPERRSTEPKLDDSSVRRRTVSASPTEPVERILDAALQVLTKHGYGGFTVRRVAEAASMTPGNMAYHFPSKRELLRALVSRLVDHYSQRLESFLNNPAAPLKEELERLVRWLLADAITHETVHIFRELWAIALHDTVIRRGVDDLYADVMDRVAEAIRRAHPAVNPTATRELIQLLALISEGSTVLYGTRAEQTVPHERIVLLVVSLIDALAANLGRDTRR